MKTRGHIYYIVLSIRNLTCFFYFLLVYSLTVACKSNNSARRNAANKILSKIREHSETLVNQSLMVSDELIRVAILWHEQWYEALEEASRLYFGELWQ